MKVKQSMSIKELAELLGVSTDTVRRAARKGLIPFTREGTAYRFELQKVLQAMRARAESMPYRRKAMAGAPGGDSRPRAQGKAPDVVTRGLG